MLDVHTGKLRWYRQLVPNDSHDWEVTRATPMFSTSVGGSMRRLVATAGKDGILRALDRDTHRWCTTFSAFEQVNFIPGKLYLGGTISLDPPAKAQGWLTAVDGSTGAVKWKYRSSRPMVAAVTTTAGNLALTGELTGDPRPWPAWSLSESETRLMESDRLDKYIVVSEQLFSALQN